MPPAISRDLSTSSWSMEFHGLSHNLDVTATFSRRRSSSPSASAAAAVRRGLGCSSAIAARHPAEKRVGQRVARACVIGAVHCPQSQSAFLCAVLRCTVKCGWVLKRVKRRVRCVPVLQSDEVRIPCGIPRVPFPTIERLQVRGVVSRQCRSLLSLVVYPPGEAALLTSAAPRFGHTPACSSSQTDKRSYMSSADAAQP